MIGLTLKKKSGRKIYSTIYLYVRAQNSQNSTISHEYANRQYANRQYAWQLKILT